MFSVMAEIHENLRRRYAEPHRAYHGQSHIDAMLAGLASCQHLFASVEAVELAIWFHDAIYDPAAQDNEARSAALLLNELSGRVDAALLERTAQMIQATATHVVPLGLPPDLDRDTALFLDLDLSVLGADPTTYDAYERGIAAEYIPVHGQDRFLAGRLAFLKALIRRPRLFLTDESHDRLDTPARTNINRAIEELAGRVNKLPAVCLALLVVALGCGHASLAASLLPQPTSGSPANSVPVLIATPSDVKLPEQIGVATMDPDGTILLQLRAEGPGYIGDGLLRYRPGQAGYDAVRAHLPALRPGVTVPVPPFR